MVQTRVIALPAVLFFLELLPRALAHGHDEGAGGTVETISPTALSSAASATMTAFMGAPAPLPPESYFSHPEMRGFMAGHITLMIVAWFFILPIGVMLSIGRSRFALPVQLSFLGVHSAGLLLSTIYTGNVPDLYPKNSHARVGWVATCLVVIQCVIGVLRLATTLRTSSQGPGSLEEQATFLPTATSGTAPDHQYQRVQSPDPYRYSNDSGHFTASNPSRSQSMSSSQDPDEEEQKLREYEDAHGHSMGEFVEKRGFLRNSKVERLASRVTAVISRRTMRVLNAIYNLIDRTIFLIGFVTFLSGAAVYGGTFRGNDIFNGLAHSIKGGIFFWYGLLTLGRWMGCFVEYGWAWNVRPPMGVVSSRQSKVPSAEFVESFVIWLYGASNVFLEHLAAWGGEWTAMDFEHVSISIMFFGGGLCGMLIESAWVRDLLNSVIITSPAIHLSPSTRERLTPPKSYPFSMNPLPALIILLLGLMMSSHHQASEVSTMVHKQWGTLFVGFALARAVTYILTYMSPPTSYLPSRPPSELISSFCLISGGIIFMASNKNTMFSLESRHIHAMFPFTVTMGFTAFLMAWTIILLAVKGWAVRRQPPSNLAAAHTTSF